MYMYIVHNVYKKVVHVHLHLCCKLHPILQLLRLTRTHVTILSWKCLRDVTETMDIGHAWSHWFKQLSLIACAENYLCTQSTHLPHLYLDQWCTLGFVCCVVALWRHRRRLQCVCWLYPLPWAPHQRHHLSPGNGILLLSHILAFSFTDATLIEF